MRIKLDLSDFLEDEHKFSVVKVNPKATKTVRDVLIKISNLFDVPVGIEDSDDVSKKPTLGLFEDENFYIHPDDTSTVLQDTGVLKLKSLPKHGGRKKKKSKKESSEDINIEKDGQEDKKHKKNSHLSEETVVEDEEGSESRKARKRKRGKTTEDAGGFEQYQEQKRSKKSSAGEDKFETENDVLGKQKGKSKRGKTADNQITEEELEELPSKKKTKKSKSKEVECELEDEIEEVSVPRKKKSKKDRVPEPSLSPELIVEERGKKKSNDFHSLQEPKASRKKGSWNRTDEDLYEMHTQSQAERKNSKSREEKRSQEKEVSTSTIINLESEEALESDDSSSSVESNREKYGSRGKMTEQSSKLFVVDPMTDPMTPEDSFEDNRKRKRKRHNKRKKLERQQENDAQGATTSRPYYDKGMPTSASTSQALDANYRWATGSANMQPLLNSSFTRKHVHFNSDDEQPVRKETIPQDIEIVETTSSNIPRDDHLRITTRESPYGRITGRTRKIDPNTYKPESSDFMHHGLPTAFRSSKNTSYDIPVDLEAEEEEQTPPHRQSYRNKVPMDPIAKTSQSNNGNFDELATLRRICENKTITVCKVDSRKEQPRSRAKEAAARSSIPSPFRAPPSPDYRSPQRPSEEAMQKFQNIMAMQNGPMPVVTQNPRQVVYLDDSDINSIRNRSQSHPYDVNGKSASKYFSPGSNKTNGQGLPGNVGYRPMRADLGKLLNSPQHGNKSIPPEFSKILGSPQQGYNVPGILKNTMSPVHQQGIRDNVMSQSPQQGVRETRTTKALASILNEASQCEPVTPPMDRIREAPQRLQQSLGSVLSNLRGKASGSGPVEAADLEIVSNTMSTHSPENKDPNVNKQGLPEKLSMPYDILPRPHLPGISPVRMESPARPVGQNANMPSPARIESEVVDLESEEEVEFPVSKAVEIEQSKNLRPSPERSPLPQSMEYARKEINLNSPSSRNIPMTVPQDNERASNSNNSPSRARGISGSRLNVPHQSPVEDNSVSPKMVISNIVGNQKESPEYEQIYEDIDDEEEEEYVEEEEEEVGLEEEEEDEGVEDEDDDDEIRVEDEREGEVDMDAEIIEDEEEDIYDDLVEEYTPMKVSKEDESARFEKDISSRLKKCLERVSQSPGHSQPEYEKINTSIRQDSSNESSRDCESTKDTHHKSDSDTIPEVDDQVQENEKHVYKPTPIRKGDRHEREMEKGSTSKEAEEVLDDDEEEEQEAPVTENKPTEELHYSTAASPRSESGEREEWLNNCPLLKDPPSVGQHIAVKRLSTDDAYCPVYSSYLEAEVMEVQGAKLILKFIDKIPKDGEEEDVEEVDLTAEKKGRATPVVEEVDWRDLNQPRLIPH